MTDTTMTDTAMTDTTMTDITFTVNQLQSFQLHVGSYKYIFNSLVESIAITPNVNMAKQFLFHVLV